MPSFKISVVFVRLYRKLKLIASWYLQHGANVVTSPFCTTKNFRMFVRCNDSWLSINVLFFFLNEANVGSWHHHCPAVVPHCCTLTYTELLMNITLTDCGDPCPVIFKICAINNTNKAFLGTWDKPQIRWQPRQEPCCYKIKYVFPYLMATYSYFCSSKYSTLISFSYEAPLFRESFKSPFTVSLVCMQTTWLLFCTGNLHEPHK